MTTQPPGASTGASTAGAEQPKEPMSAYDLRLRSLDLASGEPVWLCSTCSLPAHWSVWLHTPEWPENGGLTRVVCHQHAIEMLTFEAGVAVYRAARPRLTAVVVDEAAEIARLVERSATTTSDLPECRDLIHGCPDCWHRWTEHGMTGCPCGCSAPLPVASGPETTGDRRPPMPTHDGVVPDGPPPGPPLPPRRVPTEREYG